MERQHPLNDLTTQLLGNPAAVQRIVNRLSLLIDINASMGSTIDMESLLQKISKIAVVIMDVEASALALVDPLNHDLVFQGIDPNNAWRVPVGQGIAGWVARYGIPLIIPDVSQDPRFYGGVDRYDARNVRSVICVPLKRGEKVIGILEALNKKEGKIFNEDDLAIFYSLANIAAIAIENAQLYRLLNQKLSQLQDANTHLNNILSELKLSEAEVRALKQQMAREGTLTGRLELFAPTNLLQMLNNDQKTGTLILEHQNWRGNICFESGRIYHANMHGVPHLGGNMAVYEMVDWHTGSFSFIVDEVSNNETISDSCMHLIIEGLRRSDEMKVMQEIYPWNSVPQMGSVHFEALEGDEITSINRTILKAINGSRSLLEIWNRCTVDRHTFYSTIKDLNDKHIIQLNTHS